MQLWIIYSMLYKRRSIFDKLTDCQFPSLLFVRYSALHGFWLLEDLAELAYGPSCCGTVARRGCSFTWNLSVTRSAVFSESETRTRPNTMPHYWLAPSLPFENYTGQKPYTVLYVAGSLFPRTKAGGLCSWSLSSVQCRTIAALYQVSSWLA
jgi:hypothetical protein